MSVEPSLRSLEISTLAASIIYTNAINVAHRVPKIPFSIYRTIDNYISSTVLSSTNLLVSFSSTHPEVSEFLLDQEIGK